jgi:electron transfer flavoprotein alpha/beta subunit
MRAVALLRRAPDVALVRAAAALGDVVALAAAPDEPETRAMLAAARAAGAGRLVRLWEPALDAADYLGVGYALAAAVRGAVGDLGAAPTVILAGDRGRGAVGPAVAERLGVPLLGQVHAVELRDGRLVARRRARGLVRSFAATPPALVCVVVAEATAAPSGQDTILEGVEDWTLSKIGMSAAEVGYRRRFAPQPATAPTPHPLRLAGAAALLARLRADGLVPPEEPR